MAACELLKAEQQAKDEVKKRKAARNLVQKNAAAGERAGEASSATPARSSTSSKQTLLTWERSKPENVDAAVSRFIYGNNISARAVESKTFKDMVQAIRTAPLDWHPLHRHRMESECLQKLCRNLRNEEAPLRQSLLRFGGTVLSDGWDCVDKTHLVNELIGTSGGIFFIGTVELKSHDHEDGDFVAAILSKVIDDTGPLVIVQVCSDTCSVMKSAWQKVMTKYPWITATPCGIHVLSLELKDLCKLPVVVEITKKVKLVLSLFWGKRKWPRQCLREVIAKNHNKKFGLYRAKVTRMAGTIKEMARLLRVRSDLQSVVVSHEYQKRKAGFNKKRRAADVDVEDDEEVAVQDIGDVVRSIIMDEQSFWPELIQILRVTYPIITLLRLMDSNKPCLGQVYDRMSRVSQHLEDSTASWKADAARIHKQRWEYLHSPMHAAAYALDPQNIQVVKDIDAHCVKGLTTVLERACIRDVILQLKLDVSNEEALKHATTTVTSQHPEVVKRVAQGEREFAAYKSGKAPFNRLSCLLNATVQDPHTWWDMYGGHLEVLQGVAQRILAQVSSAHAAERNWSIYGHIKNDRRSQMGHSRADGRVYCHEAIQLHEKLHRVTDEIVEFSDDSDADSNASVLDEDEEIPLEQLMR